LGWGKGDAAALSDNAQGKTVVRTGCMERNTRKSEGNKCHGMRSINNAGKGRSAEPKGCSKLQLKHKKKEKRQHGGRKPIKTTLMEIKPPNNSAGKIQSPWDDQGGAPASKICKGKLLGGGGDPATGEAHTGKHDRIGWGGRSSMYLEVSGLKACHCKRLRKCRQGNRGSAREKGGKPQRQDESGSTSPPTRSQFFGP